ncbi:maternal protein exuperantia [Cylas formicarius]|uniref:maternal protein exuperantia n=1 Tax=Cylas formicarius TaxID=197179 RepID=UPI0029584125|nr:maternal protein exuperantia [Cylas formicarius]XP_060532548.1 maternal protein exuperantia [Cylas formicarius]
MVQHDTSSSSDENTASQLQEIAPKGIIPIGNYRLVGWAVDTTGRRLIDEIVQIAAYTPESQFSQYIMPFTDLNPFYSRRHNIRVFNTFRYRRLKDMTTGKFLKTKSEISALADFVDWLEKVKGDSEGIILVSHEGRKSIPGMLLEALKRNNLLDHFKNVVKGFANGFNVAKSKCKSSTKTYNLKVMSRVLLSKEDVDFRTAVGRASAVYNILVHLAQGEREDLGDETITDNAASVNEKNLIDLVCPFTNPISAEEEEIEVFKVILQRQNTFRPVFGALMRAGPHERQHASHLRRLLAENNFNYDKLKDAYDVGGKEGLEKILKDEVANAKETDLNELLEILDCFFDPQKKPVQPKTGSWNNRYNNNRPRPRQKSTSKGRSNSQSERKESETKESSEIKNNSQEEVASIDSNSVPPVDTSPPDNACNIKTSPKRENDGETEVKKETDVEREAKNEPELKKEAEVPAN